MYHGILKEDMPMPCWWQAPYKEFEWQIKYLKEHYTVMHLREVMQKVQQGTSLPDHTAVITFDDGFKNNYTAAYPLLKQLDLPATIFLVTSYIGTDRLLWPDELFMLFLDTSTANIDLRSFGLGVFDLKTLNDKQKAFYQVLEHLKTLKLDDKNKMAGYIKDALSVPAAHTAYADNFKLLSWQDVDLMEAGGLIDWGGHTCTHEILSNLDDKTLNDEIKGSCAAVSKYDKDLLFAYPNGRKRDFDGRAKAILKGTNALCSLTTVSGLNASSQDPYELKRVGVGNTTTREQFKLLCSGVVL